MMSYVEDISHTYIHTYLPTYRSLFLQEPITVDGLHKAIKEEAYGLDHKPGR